MRNNRASRLYLHAAGPQVTLAIISNLSDLKVFSGFKFFQKEIALRSMFLAPALCSERDVGPYAPLGSKG